MKIEWVTRVCPVCQTADHSQVFVESRLDLDKLDTFAFASRKLPEYMHFRLLECDRCGVLYGNPVLSTEVLQEAYRTAGFDSGEEARYASCTYGREVRNVIDRLPDLDGALDIGTGDGVFLEELLDLGFRNVTGAEPSQAPVDTASPCVRPLIHVGPFRKEDYRPGSFSLITCFQVMEHVPDPLEASRTAWELLKPGGVFIIVVHNRKSLSARLMGLKSPIFDIEHLQLFCPQSAHGLLQCAGFQNIEVHPLWNRYPIRYWVRLSPIPHQVKRHMLSFLQWSSAGRLPVSVPAGNLVAVGFR